MLTYIAIHTPLYRVLHYTHHISRRNNTFNAHFAKLTTIRCTVCVCFFFFFPSWMFRCFPKGIVRVSRIGVCWRVMPVWLLVFGCSLLQIQSHPTLHIICIPENILYTYTLPMLYHWNDRAIISILNVELCILHSDPDPDSQPIAKARVLYVYVYFQFVSAALPRSRAVAICPTHIKRGKHRAQCCAEVGFSCIKFDWITRKLGPAPVICPCHN